VTCTTEYTLSSDGSFCDNNEVDEPTAEAIGIAVATIAVSSIVANVLVASITASSSPGAWIMINQYQLLLTTPILETEMPDDLLVFLEETQFFTFSFSFLQGWKFGETEELVDDFDFDLEVIGIEAIGYESGSIIVNEYNFGKFMLLVF
jgi:hypothetical protein